MKRTRNQNRVFLAIAAAFLMTATTAISPTLLPFLTNTAIFSVGLSMPEGYLYSLKEQLSPNEEFSVPLDEEALPPIEIPPTTIPPSNVDNNQGLDKNEVEEEDRADNKGEQTDENTKEDAEEDGKRDPLPTIPPPVDATPDIPKKYQGKLLTEQLLGSEGSFFYNQENTWLRNYTDYSSTDLDDILATPIEMKIEDLDEPLVFIYHTHATESYNPNDSDIYDTRYNWRSTDNNNNMVAVGAVLKDTLEQQGIAVIHDTSQHDYPSYNGAYDNSCDAIEKVLAENPSIKILLDLHRDAIERDEGVIVKPTAVVNGEKVAQILVVANSDDGSGLIPNWRENLRLGFALTTAMEEEAPGLTRPLLFSHRKYNQHLSTGALLIEVGSHANTLEEAKLAAYYLGKALAELVYPLV